MCLQQKEYTCTTRFLWYFYDIFVKDQMPKTGTAKLSKCAPKQKAGTVLPFSSAACYVTLQRESEIACICVGDFVYFVVNKLSFFAGPCPFFIFCMHAFLLCLSKDQMYSECARGAKHPVSFSVSVPQIAPFKNVAEIGPFTFLF